MDFKTVFVTQTDNGRFYLVTTTHDKMTGRESVVKSLVLDTVAEVGVVIEDTFKDKVSLYDQQRQEVEAREYFRKQKDAA